jgi:uncharacterized protein YjbI with pentapeptide repeats
MARFSKTEVLRRYQAGERDFSGADLRSLRFRGATLAGADFSGTDLRGTDFLDADLRGAKFVGARCGVPLGRWLGQGAMGGVLGAIGGLITALGYVMMAVGVLSISSEFGLSWAISIAFCILIGAIVFVWEGFSSKGIGFASVSGIGVVVSSFMLAVSGGVLSGGAALGSGAVAAAMAVAGTIAGSTLIAVGCAISSISTIIFALYFAAFGAGAGTLSTGVPVVLIVLPIVVLAFVRSCKRLPGYAGCRSFGIALGTIGATRFSGADLRGAFFTDALLARANFAASRRQTTSLERVCLHGAKGLELALVKATLLEEPRCRQLLLGGSVPETDLHGLNLRGAYMPQADLRGADLRETNLSEAVLTEAHLENANLKASQCLGTDLAGAHLTGATLEGWNIDHATKLVGVDCAYVYLLEPMDAQGKRRDDHHRERLPHDPDKSFGPGDFETYFKQLIEEVKLLIKNGVDAKAFQQAFQEVMRQHPQITPESITGLKRSGNDVLITLQAPASVDKGAVEQTFFDKYNAVKLENARLHGLLAGERRVSEVERERATQFAELASRLVPAANPSPHPTTVVNTTTIHTGDGNLINTGSLNTAGGLVNLGDLSDQARLTIEAIPDQRTAVGQPSLRQLLQQLKDSVDADSHLPETSRAEALAEIKALATAAQVPKQNVAPARRAINALKGLSAGLSETNKAVAETSKLVGAVKTLLPLIAGFFLG